jgi:hypothetical protein
LRNCCWPEMNAVVLGTELEQDALRDYVGLLNTAKEVLE